MFFKSQKSSSSNNPAAVPRHIAIIMDGNGRWARERGLPRGEGHRAGAKTVRMVVEECRRLGVRYLTLFCFSTENWGRPADEVAALMRLFVDHLTGEAENLSKNGVRLRAIGELERLPPDVRKTLDSALDATATADKLDLILAISYGGREELIGAARKLAQRCQSGEIAPSEISEEVFKSALYAPDVPDPDLLIRTSAEQRISNFLLWQLAYSELVVSDKYWPGFNKEDFEACLLEYSKRGRRFGLTEEQLESLPNKK